MSRLSIDEYFVRMLELVSDRSTCGRRSVGAIIVNGRNHVMATGYNGTPRNFPHCRDTGGEHDQACPGRLDKSGDSDRCFAVHAELNALLQWRDLQDVCTLYVSCAPCFTCAKAIANTNIIRVVYVEGYADIRGLQVLNSANILAEQFTLTQVQNPK